MLPRVCPERLPRGRRIPSTTTPQRWLSRTAPRSPVLRHRAILSFFELNRYDCVYTMPHVVVDSALASIISFKPRPHGHDLCRGVLFLRRNPVSISIDELYVRRRGQRGPTGCVLARAPTALPGGRARLIARVWSRACVTEPAPTGLPPSRADGSPENFSAKAFDMAHMYVCISLSVS